MEDSDYTVSDEEISTNKERHSRLGEDNLDDTLEYDFSGPPLREKKLKELQPKDDVLPSDKATHHEVKPQTDSVLMMDAVFPPVSRSPECGISNPYISHKNVANIPEAKKAEGVKDKTEQTFKQCHPGRRTVFMMHSTPCSFSHVLAFFTLILFLF